jgi:hypothetical protein
VALTFGFQLALPVIIVEIWAKGLLKNCFFAYFNCFLALLVG